MPARAPGRGGILAAVLSAITLIAATVGVTSPAGADVPGPSPNVSFAAFPSGVPAWAMAVDRQSDGKFVVAGFATVGPADRFALARFNADGSPDTTFGTDGTGTVTTPVGLMPSGSGAMARDLRILPDGTIVLGGTAYWYKDAEYPALGADPKKNTRVFALVGYTPDGVPDPAFGASYAGPGHQDGVVLVSVMRNDQITALSLSGSMIVAAGTAKAQDPPGKMFALAQFASDGSLNTAFGDKGTITTRFGGTSLNNVPLDVFVGADGSIVVIGTDNDGTGGNSANFAIAKFSRRGAVQEELKTLLSIDGEFNAAYGGELMANGKVLVAGVTYDTDTDRLGMVLVRLQPDLTVDTSFGDNGRTVTFVPGWNQSAITSVEIQPDGGLIASGFVANAITGPVPWALNRYWHDGRADPAFATGGTATSDVGVPLGASDNNSGFDGAVDVQVQPDGSNVATGTALSEVGGNPTFALALYPTSSIAYRGPTDRERGDWPVSAEVFGNCRTGTAAFSVGNSQVSADVVDGRAATQLAVPAGSDRLQSVFTPTGACYASSQQTAVTSREPNPPVQPVKQRPVAPLNLPKHLWRHGRTMVLQLPVRTNAGQKARVVVKGTGIATWTAGEVRGQAAVRVVRRDGHLYIWLSGERRTTVTIKVKAPAVAGYTAMNRSRTYRTPAAG